MLKTFPDYESLSRGGAEFVSALGGECIEKQKSFNLVLAGGSTPQRMHQLLAEIIKDEQFWKHTSVYFSDERWVAKNNPDNNYYQAKLSLLDKVPIPAEQVHPIPTELKDPNTAAERYSEIFPEHPDLIILGIGDDGHTASLFPHSPALDEREKGFIPAIAPYPPVQRITATIPTIISAKNILVLVSGAKKAEAIQKIFSGNGSIEETPARIALSGRWFIDEDAGKFHSNRN